MENAVERGLMLGEADVLDFYERTGAEVYRYASRLVGGDRGRAEDLVQETFLTLVRQVRAGRSEPVDVGWAITTCRSRFLDQIRRAGVVERTRRRAYERPLDGDASAPNDATQALVRLSDAQRAALVLRYVDDMSVLEVATAMRRSLHATESLLKRARESLRTEYNSATGRGADS